MVSALFPLIEICVCNVCVCVFQFGVCLQDLWVYVHCVSFYFCEGGCGVEREHKSKNSPNSMEIDFRVFTTELAQCVGSPTSVYVCVCALCLFV